MFPEQAAEEEREKTRQEMSCEKRHTVSMIVKNVCHPVPRLPCNPWF